MRTKRLKANDNSVEFACDVLRRGGVVAFPTDTVYGIGARWDDQAAVEKLYEVKERSAEKAIPLLLASAKDMTLVAKDIPDLAWRLAAVFWPGGLTLVLPKRDEVPSAVSATDTVAVRVPAHDLTLKLLRLAGLPVATTSANVSGRASARNADEVWTELRGRIDLLIDGGPCPGGVASTIVDLTAPLPVVLREGAISSDRLKAVCGPLGGPSSDELRLRREKLTG